jgi:RimJ/RimL family protein N-acetyltransferase
MEAFLETDRLVLRRFTDADVDNLVDLDADPEVMFFINAGTPTPRDEIEQTVLPRFLRYYATYPAWGFFAVIEKATGDFIGWFHLRPDPEGGRPDEPELGYRLRRSAWGKGYATEGSRALVDRAFSDLGAARVFATTMAVNAASRRVMEKAGLRFVRIFDADWPVRIPGDEHGDVEYAITRPEWERDRLQEAGPGER